MPHENVVRSVWETQATWSETAVRLKSSLFRWRFVAAIAGVFGALLETLAATIASLGDGAAVVSSVVAIVGALTLAVVPYVQRTKASRDRMSEWVRARSVSEDLKEQVYRFLLKVSPYDRVSPVQELLRQRESLLNKVTDLNRYAALIAPVVHARPTELSAEEYVEERVNAQINDYYRPKGRAAAARAQRLHRWEFGVGLAATVLGALSGIAAATGFFPISAWVAVLTTAGAALTAHIAGSNLDRQVMTYFATANRLEWLRDSWTADPNRLELDRIARFVRECEHAISTENEAWLAEWLVKNAPDGDPAQSPAANTEDAPSEASV